MHQYFILNKPFGVISQFSPEGNHTTLKDICTVPEDVYPVGRLDTDSEGLLLLTNDKSLNHKLLNPKTKTPKTYWVQVEGIPTADNLKQLEKGVEFSAKGKKYISAPCEVSIVEPTGIWERNPPIRYRANVSTTWLSIRISEGKNRQVRKMTAAIGYPTLRLVRPQLGRLNIFDEKIKPGQCRAYSYNDLKKHLPI